MTEDRSSGRDKELPAAEVEKAKHKLPEAALLQGLGTALIAVGFMGMWLLPPGVGWAVVALGFILMFTGDPIGRMIQDRRGPRAVQAASRSHLELTPAVPQSLRARLNADVDAAGLTDPRAEALVCDVIAAVVALSGDDALGSDDRHTVDRMGEDYLPSVLRAYAAVPVEARDAVVGSAGLTATQNLTQQLQVLLNAANSIRDARARDSLVELEATGRFLADRFTPSALDAMFDQPGPEAR